MHNPLTKIDYFIPFDTITHLHIEPALNEILAEARRKLDEVINFQGQRTFDNTMLALEELGEKLEFFSTLIGHIDGVKSDESFSGAVIKAQGPISEFQSSIYLSEGLWTAIKNFAATDEAKSLSKERARYLEVVIRDFKQAGADLPANKKEELVNIDMELSELTQKFEQNATKSSMAFELLINDKEQLSGLPQAAIDQARESAQSKGLEGWRFTLKFPSYVAVLTYLDDASIREKMFRAFNSKANGGDFDNSAIIPRVLQLRQRKAEILGFSNFADFILQDRMAKNGATAVGFLRSLAEKTSAKFAEENSALHAFRKSLEGENAHQLKPWDIAYYAEKLRKKLYDFDRQLVREYFPYDKVISGLFEIANKLYGVSFVKSSAYPLWHKDVEVYEMFDKSGSLIGSFYTDFFSREGKRDGAWMNCFIPGRPEGGTFKRHHGLIAGNFTPASEDKPSLLLHDEEVETTFHEFGHLLHQLFSTVGIRSLGGISVAWDFVELPSQIMENWCWEREALDIISGHYKTGEKLPDELFAKMLGARNFRKAYQVMRQVSMAALDLDLHMNYSPGKDGDVVTYSRNFLQKYSAVKLEDDYSFITSFTHLFADPVAYAAGYYSYHWAEALEADAFGRFKKEGIFNPKTAEDFRLSILSLGNSEEAEDLFRKFMGRDPDNSAFLVRAGLG